MELFESAENTEGQPLAHRMRPRTIDEYCGQDHIVGPGRLLRRMIQADQLSSIIFYGPPGTGKTTLARVIANTTERTFITMNAVLSGVKDLRTAIAEAKDRLSLHGKRTILFVDEVHRWNKAQQDALLPWVENGTVILIGATTQNPYFEVISALVSRSRIFQLKPLTEDDLLRIAKAAIADPERGYGRYDVTWDSGALSHLVQVAAGDARSLLNAIELSVKTTPSRFPPPEGERIRITLEIAEESIQRKAVLYDKEGDYHFDTISAFIKSLRGSDPDAALYWMARMIHAGEDPHYIFRRMLILAGEDVGLADPSALSVVVSAASAFDRVGMPEGQFHLTEAALYLATAPKSNSTLAFFDAAKAVEEEAAQEVPNHLRDASRDKEGFGHGEGYLYPHAYRDHWAAQQYLPQGLQGRIFYQPSDQGYEGRVKDVVARRREAQLAATAPDQTGEVLTFSPAGGARDRWLSRVTSKRSEVLEEIRDSLFHDLDLRRHHRILVLNASTGLILWEAFRRVPEGGVWGIACRPEEGQILRHFADALPETEQPSIVDGETISALEVMAAETVRFELVIGMNVFTREPRRSYALKLVSGLMAPEGSLALAETVPRHAQRLSEMLDSTDVGEELVDTFRLVEDGIYKGGVPGMTDWDENQLLAECEGAGFCGARARLEYFDETRVLTEDDLTSWFASDSPYGKLMAEYLSEAEIETIKHYLSTRFVAKPIPWKRAVCLLNGTHAPL